MKCSKKILALMISLSIIFAIILSMTLLRKSSRSLEQKNDNNTAYIFETDHGEVSGTLDDWLSGEYADYVLDEGKSSCDGDNDSSGLSWDNERHTVLLTSNEADKCTLYFHLGSKNLGDSIKDLVGSGNEVVSGDGYLYYHDSSLENGARDNGYRYAGDKPNNYICFGAGSESYNSGSSDTCPTTNKYRIIGLVPVTVGNENKNLVKIIKAEYITADELGISSTGTVSSNSSYTSLKRIEGSATSVPGFHWNDASNNTWNGSSLYNALNGKYLNTTLGSWANKVETVKWNVGGGTDANLRTVTAQNAYKQEITNGSGTTVDAKVGLMYAHDYGFASQKGNWSSILNNYSNDNNMKNNWLFNGVYEWTISRYSSNSNNAFFVYNSGLVNGYNSVNGNSNGVRPVLYLTSDVKLGGGDGIDGSQSKPYKVS